MDDPLGFFEFFKVTEEIHPPELFFFVIKIGPVIEKFDVSVPVLEGITIGNSEMKSCFFSEMEVLLEFFSPSFLL
jgi:hypothetical protein